MSKETLIIFVYDIHMSGTEQDESLSPVLYFYPTWVSSEQKSALCGQIVGTVECVAKLFCRPKILAVASGNFYIIFEGRFIFAVGTETNSTNLRLQHRAKIIFSLFEFLHSDLDSLLEMGTTEFSSKLQSIVDNHLRMLMYSNSILFHNSSISLSKSLDGVYMDAVHILESCRALEGVLGGILLYKNKVVATQLGSDLTQRLSSADLYRIQSSATSVDHNLPSGINIFQVYIPNEDYVKLLESSKKSKLVFGRLNNGEIKITKNERRSQDMSLMSAMKRDQSLLFTAVPEDSSVSWDQPYIPTTKRNRPKFLNLKTTISIGNSSELKSKVNSGTPLCSQTSICSTPLKELKKIIHQHPLSICHNEEDDSDFSFNNLETRIVESVTTKEPSGFTTELRDIKNRFKSFPNISDIFSNHKKHRIVTKSKTISDPTFPVFKEDGTIMSMQYPRDFNGKHNTQLNGNANSINRKKTDTFADVLIKEEACTNNNKSKKSLELLDLLTRNQRQTDNGNDEFSKTLNSKLSKLVSSHPASFSKLYHMKKDSVESTKNYPCQEYKTKSTLVAEKNKSEEKLKECSLFVNGKQDISMAVLLSKENSKEQNDMIKMVDMSTEYIDKLQRTFRHKVESCNSSESNLYRYLYLDSDCNSVKQKGTWSTHDLTVVGYLCEDFTDAENEITEVLVRGTDNIILGQHSGTFDAFYNETASFSPGLPPPIDPIGVIQVKARKKLERDHMPVLF